MMYSIGYRVYQLCSHAAPPSAAPETPTVTFIIPREQFTISWDDSPLNTGEMSYFVNISGRGDLCGNVDALQNVTERSYNCTIQPTPQEGDPYTIRVAAANCNGRQRGPQSSPARLQGI